MKTDAWPIELVLEERQQLRELKKQFSRLMDSAAYRRSVCAPNGGRKEWRLTDAQAAWRKELNTVPEAPMMPA